MINTKVRKATNFAFMYLSFHFMSQKKVVVEILCFHCGNPNCLSLSTFLWGL